MTPMFTIDGNELHFNPGPTVRFSYPIWHAIAFEKAVVVLLNIPQNVIFNENVFGVDLYGHVIWQIQSHYPPTKDAAFGGLEELDGHAVLSNTDGLALVVEPATGQVIRKYEQLR